MRINIFYTFLGNQIIQYIQIITIKITAGGVAKLMQSAVNICMYVLCMYVCSTIQVVGTHWAEQNSN